MQLVRAAGQLLQVAQLPQGAQVRINGTVAAPNDQGLFVLPVGQVSEVIVARGSEELFRGQVPATAAGETRTVTVPVRRAADVSDAPYEPGSRDDIRNRAAKAKACMSLFGIGATLGAVVALVKLSRE